jgi:hypothetical protein
MEESISGVQPCVTNCVTENESAGVMNRETKSEPTGPPKKVPDDSGQPGLVRLLHRTNQMLIRECDDKASAKRHDNGSTRDDLTSGSVVMGKLCQHALALIKHKVGADGTVSSHMAWALAAWLRL